MAEIKYEIVERIAVLVRLAVHPVQQLLAAGPGDVGAEYVLHGTFFTPDEDSEETFAICALLHDLCKANFYKKGTRNVKNEATGQWEKVPSYSVEDMFPYGHGEKSVFLIVEHLGDEVLAELAKLMPQEK